jgi:hypothetical protein
MLGHALLLKVRRSPNSRGAAFGRKRPGVNGRFSAEKQRLAASRSSLIDVNALERRHDLVSDYRRQAGMNHMVTAGVLFRLHGWRKPDENQSE